MCPRCIRAWKRTRGKNMPWEVVEVVDLFELTSRNVWKFKKKKTVDGPLGNREIYKESRRRVGNEN